ncbi:MAG: XRE family transcriptional regulator [Myxococcota bacterium]|nr:XRE family transcriptional regulator [Myxococcota bacterium]
MDKPDKNGLYEDYTAAVDGFSNHKEDDMLTDPEAVAAIKEMEERKRAIAHGQKLLSTRERLGFTLTELGQKTGIDEEVLSQVEKGESFLPLGQLSALSKALNLRVSDVISTGKERFTIVRSGDRERFSRFGKAKQASQGYEYEALALQKQDRKMEPFVVTLHPSDDAEQSSHDGQEFIFVLQGAVELVIEDKRELLGPGDAAYYDSNTPHHVRAHGPEPTKILAVLSS